MLLSMYRQGFPPLTCLANAYRAWEGELLALLIGGVPPKNC